MKQLIRKLIVAAIEFDFLDDVVAPVEVYDQRLRVNFECELFLRLVNPYAMNLLTDCGSDGDVDGHREEVRRPKPRPLVIRLLSLFDG